MPPRPRRGPTRARPLSTLHLGTLSRAGREPIDWPSVADLNEASRWRLRLAALAAPAYASDAGVAAVAVGGSTARGCADRHSDVELAVWWSHAPTDDQRRQAAERLP